MELTSSDVAQDATFALTHVCPRYSGSNVSPALAWSGVPANTKSLAVTMYDPDAHGGWWHWLALDIPPSTTALPQGAGGKRPALADGGRQHGNSNGDEHYDGPCPPAGSGVHHYQITVWALDEDSAAVDVNAEPGEVGAYLAKHAIDKAQITPVYGK
jgi:Raf kinase inhibitor-like YbhB/YbcL family protein